MADEVEAVLAGTYVEHLHARGRPIPPWAYLNEAAHAPVSALVARINTWEYLRRITGGGQEVGWFDAEAALAGEVVAVAEGDAGIVRRLQREVLVPLELRLAGRPQNSTVTAGQLVGIARAALYGHPSAGPRSKAA